MRSTRRRLCLPVERTDEVADYLARAPRCGGRPRSSRSDGRARSAADTVPCPWGSGRPWGWARGGLAAVTLVLPGPARRRRRRDGPPRRPASRSCLPGACSRRRPVPPPDAAAVAVQVQLRLRDQAGADALALAVSTPGQPRLPPLPDARASSGPASRPPRPTVATGVGVADEPGPHRRPRSPPTTSTSPPRGPPPRSRPPSPIGLATIEVNGGQRRVNTSEPAVPAELVAASTASPGSTEVLAHPTHVGGARRVAGGPADRGRRRTPAGPGARPPRPAPGFRTAGPCSNWWDEEQAAGLPRVRERLPGPAAVGAVRLDAARARGGPTASTVRSQQRHRRLGRPVAVVDAYASPTILDDASAYARRNDPEPSPAEAPARRAGLPARAAPDPSATSAGWYGGADARRRGRPRHGPGGHILATSAHGAADDPDLLEADHRRRRRPAGRHRLQLVRRTRVSCCPAASVRAALAGPHPGRRSRASASIYSSGDDGDWSNDRVVRRAAARPPSSPASSPLATAVGGTSLGLAATARSPSSRGWTTGHQHVRPRDQDVRPRRQGRRSCTAPAAGRAGCSTSPRYQQGVVPNGIAGASARPGGAWSPTSAWSATPTRACSSGRRRPSPRASATTSTASAAPASRRRCSRG